MLSRFSVALAICVGVVCTATYADVIEVEGTVKEINAEERTLTLSRKRGKAEKVIELEVAEKADIKAGESDADLADIKEGDEVAVKYDSKLEIVTELVKGGAEEKNYAKLLRKKFAASRATLDAKTGVLTLAYDFKKPDQLKDFDTSAATPKLLGNGAVRLSPADKMTHLAVFKEGTFQAAVKFENNKRQRFLSANGVWADYGEGYYCRVFFMPKEKNMEFKNANEGIVYTCQLAVAPERVKLTVNGKELGYAKEGGETGSFTLHGGDSGIAFGTVTISGIPEPLWFKEFMDK